jgi:hypothetical protein
LDERGVLALEVLRVDRRRQAVGDGRVGGGEAGSNRRQDTRRLLVGIAHFTIAQPITHYYIRAALRKAVWKRMRIRLL